METIAASVARAKLFGLLAGVSQNDEPKLIASQKGDCVLISKKEWDSIQETIYLMSNPKTKRDILDGLSTPLSECVDELPW
jgi:prevent-host-death family protein